MRVVRWLHSFLAVVLLLVGGSASTLAYAVSSPLQKTPCAAALNKIEPQAYPIEELRLTLETRNRLFVANNPVNLVDPDGRCFTPETLWDLGNLLYDAWTGEWGHFAFDLAATFTPFVPAGASKAFKAAEAAKTTVGEGTELFRVFGNEAKGLGQYYTTVNPNRVANFREAVGLFPGNSGQFVLQGTLKNTEGVIFRGAAPGPGGIGGGLPEVFVPNPQTQINILRVSGANPAF